MWWITIIVLAIMLGQTFLLTEKDNDINPINQFMILILSLVLYIFTLLVVSFNTNFITPTIEDYEKGAIIKVENITIQGTDTVKVIKYKYK
jgi:hypothetical protein